MVRPQSPAAALSGEHVKGGVGSEGLLPAPRAARYFGPVSLDLLQPVKLLLGLW